MSKEEVIVLEGRVVEALPGGKFRVELTIEGMEEKMEVTASISGKMRMNNIRVTLGDRVKVELSNYNPEEGRIVYRFK